MKAPQSSKAMSSVCNHRSIVRCRMIAKPQEKELKRMTSETGNPGAQATRMDAPRSGREESICYQNPFATLNARNFILSNGEKFQMNMETPYRENPAGFTAGNIHRNPAMDAQEYCNG
jgi:hypothetical protein